jgi:hypothetical protein
MPIEVFFGVQAEMPKPQDASLKVAVQSNINEAFPCA